MPGKWALATLCAVPVLLVGCGGSDDPASTGSIPAKVRAELLEDARRVAADNGDPHPYDIEAVRTTLEKARSALSPGSSHPQCESSPTCANWPTYAVAMRGQFNGNDIPGPPRAKNGPFTVATFIMPAKEPAPKYYPSPVGLGGGYPNLKEAGHPVRLG